MKRVISLAFILAFVGCDQVAETGTTNKDSANVVGMVQSPGSNEAPASQTESPKSQVFQFGIYEATKKGRITDSSETNTGKVVRKPVLEHVSMTDRIPLVKDTHFGFQYRLWDLPAEVTIKRVMQLRSVLIHPEMTLADGSISTGWDRSVKGIVKTRQVLGFDGYAFHEDYELVEGDWIFQVWYQDKKLLERKFVTVQPQQDVPAEPAKKE